MLGEVLTVLRNDLQAVDKGVGNDLQAVATAITQIGVFIGTVARDVVALAEWLWNWGGLLVFMVLEFGMIALFIGLGIYINKH